MRLVRHHLKEVIRAGLPPLENGEQLSQVEFHRRYKEYPDGKQFELVGGTVFRASPVRLIHGVFDEEVGFLFGLYRRATPGVQAARIVTVILGEKSEPQPDLTLRIAEEFGGQSRINAEKYLEGPPELVAEISYSTRSLDMHAKRRDYQQAGVLEYLVVCLEEQELHWFHFPSDRAIKPNLQGVLRSRVFPGLWIDSAALFVRDSARLTQVLQEGLASREHAAFVKRLEAARRKLR